MGAVPSDASGCQYGVTEDAGADESDGQRRLKEIKEELMFTG